jgi:hypothetical protein
MKRPVTCDALFSIITTYVVNADISRLLNGSANSLGRLMQRRVFYLRALHRGLRRVSALRVEPGFGFFQQRDGRSSFERKQMGN